MQSLGKLIDLPKIIDPRGNLTVAQQYAQVPFGIQRVYWTYDVPQVKAVAVMLTAIAVSLSLPSAAVSM